MQTKNAIQEAISREMNALIEAISILVIGISAVLTATYFGVGSDNLVIRAQAVIYAFGIDGMFYICVRLSRHYLAQGWSLRGVALGLWWMAWAFGLGAFTWHNNLLFAANEWQLNPQALARAGVTDSQELQLHAIIPVAVVLLVAIIPRRHAKDTRTPEQILADAKQEIALMKAKNQVRSAKAEVSGEGLRGAIGGFMDQALNLKEKRAEEAAREHQRQSRRERHDRLTGLAHIHGLDPSADDLEAQLTRLGVWPQVDMSATSSAIEEATESAKQRAIKRPLSGPLPTHFTASEVAAKIGKPVRTVSRWMSADYDGPYKIHARFIKSRNARCANASEIARIIVLLKGENPPVDTPDEGITQPSLEAMPVLVVGQSESQPEGQSNGHFKGQRKRQSKGQPLGQPEGQDEEIE